MFRTFPGTGGSFSAETPDINDTILGQTFESTERGLIDWNVSTDGIYKGYPGYTCRLNRAVGTVAFNGEATTELGAKVFNVAGEEKTLYGFQITNIYKRVWRRPAAGTTLGVSALDGATNLPITLVDYLTGTIWTETDGGADVTVASVTNYGYTKLVALARATDYTLTLGVTMRDESNFVESNLTSYDRTTTLGTGDNGQIIFLVSGNIQPVVTHNNGGPIATLALVDPGAADETLAVTFVASTGAITVSLATNATSDLTSTAADVVNALNANDDITEHFGPASVISYSGDGTGVLAALATSDIDPGSGYPGPINKADPDGRGGYMLYSPGLRTVSLSISGVTIPERKFANELNFRTALQNREELIIEVNPDGLDVGGGTGNGIGFRMWMKFASASEEGDVGQTQTTSLEFTLSVPYDEKIVLPFNMDGRILRLPGALIDAFDSWINEEYQNEVRYLPSGTTDGTGITGKVIISDLSLSGGLTSMNTFNVEMMGNGRYTEV